MHMLSLTSLTATHACWHARLAARLTTRRMPVPHRRRRTHRHLLRVAVGAEAVESVAAAL